MKNLGIYYFSGTGNTEIAAKLVAEEFTALGWEVDLIRMEDVNKDKVDLYIEQYDMVGFASQVIGYGIPEVVRQFAKLLPTVSDNKKVFIFRTAGGVAPINYNVSKKLIRMLTKKHYDVCYEQLFSIGSNWILKFDDVIMKQLYQATKQRIAYMCKQIEQGERHRYKTGKALRMKMGLISVCSSLIFPLFGKDANVTSSCNQCGLCVRRCPADNIVLKNGKIKFRTKCSACLRCVYSCPRKAIHLRLFGFIPIPEGYNVLKSLSVDGNPNEKPNGKIPPFLKEYLEDKAI